MPDKPIFVLPNLHKPCDVGCSLQMRKLKLKQSKLSPEPQIHFQVVSDYYQLSIQCHYPGGTDESSIKLRESSGTEAPSESQ